MTLTAPKKLSLAKETLAHLRVKTGTKAGLKPVSGGLGPCLSVGQYSTCVSVCSNGTLIECCA